MQIALTLRPEMGVLIPATGGARKIRWRSERRGQGKRGGARIIYYWHSAEGVFYMLFAYSKDEQDDLSSRQKKAVRDLIEEEFV